MVLYLQLNEYELWRLTEASRFSLETQRVGRLVGKQVENIYAVILKLEVPF